MSRRKITEEAQKQSQEVEKERDRDGEDDSERKQTPWRADEELMDDLDEFADRYGLSRNAAITMAVQKMLESW